MSLEDHKMMAIMRQIEQTEQKEKTNAGPSTPHADGKCDRDEAEDSVEVELPASHKKRKECENEDLSSCRKKPRAGDEKQKQMQEKEAVGALVGLQSHKVVTDAPRPVLLSMGKSTSHPVLQGEYDTVTKSLRFHGKKGYKQLLIICLSISHIKRARPSGFQHRKRPVWILIDVWSTRKNFLQLSHALPNGLTKASSLRL